MFLRERPLGGGSAAGLDGQRQGLLLVMMRLLMAEAVAGREEGIGREKEAGSLRCCAGRGGADP